MSSKNRSSFVDPIRKLWGGLVLFGLLFRLLPIWPVQGNWFGFPAWSVLVLLSSFLTSCFTAFVICRVWQDPDEPGDRTDHD